MEVENRVANDLTDATPRASALLATVEEPKSGPLEMTDRTWRASRNFIALSPIQHQTGPVGTSGAVEASRP